MQWAASGLVGAWSDESVRLPVPWDSLGRFVSPRGGQQVVLLAAPGVGKTVMSLNWAARANLRTLYHSADTDPQTMTEQAATIATGHPRWVVAERLNRSPTWRLTYAEAVRDRYPNLVMDFSSSPRIGETVQKIEALTEVWGLPPQLVVFDTASDVHRDAEDNDSWQKQWKACRELSRHFDLVALHNHHVKQGEAASGTVMPTLNSGMWKPDQFSEVVLGLCSDTAGQLSVGILKNRGGRKGVVVRLRADYDRARLEDVA